MDENGQPLSKRCVIEESRLLWSVHTVQRSPVIHPCLSRCNGMNTMITISMRRLRVHAFSLHAEQHVGDGGLHLSTCICPARLSRADT